MTGFKVRSAWILISAIFISLQVNGQRAKDGARTVNGTVFANEFTALTADAATGATNLTVANSAMNANGRFSGVLAPGDLILVMQMQGASMSNAGSPTYGTVTNYNNCGLYEFVEVLAVPNANNIQLSCGLVNSYTAGGHTQIVRVPRWSSLTVQAGGTLTTDNWNGATGGILAVEILGATVINAGGSIDASGRGFRGGNLENDGSPMNITAWFSNISTNGGEKGESIVGFGPEYDALGGRYCRGAPANGGGGGNAHNGGGGGGANAGNPNTWNGLGNPDNSVAAWTTAWNLEGPGFSGNSSSGGGRGGYSFSSSNQNAITIGPGNGAWGGDNRRNNGGYGAHPLDYSTGRLFLGGGGGAGDENNGAGGAGGAGGGLIYLLSYDGVSGAGEIRSNGGNGGSTIGGGNDGPGGAGGGGTIVVNADNGVTGVSILANGGLGGNQFITNNEAEGPGGGGGGGYIAISGGAPARAANGGGNGTTNSPSLTEFIPNGATQGGVGTPNASISNYGITVGPDTICSGNSTTLIASLTGTIPAGVSIVWWDAEVGGSVLGTGATFTTPTLFATTTYYVGPCPGTYRIPVEVFVRPVPQAQISGPVNFCANSPGAVYSSPNHPGNTYNWVINGGTIASGQGSNSVTVNWGAAGNATVSLTETDPNGCDTTVSYNVVLQALPNPVINGPLSACENTGGHVYSVQNVAGHTFNWTLSGGTISAGQGSNSITVDWGTSGPGQVTLSQTSPLGCNTTVSINVTVLNKPNPVISGPLVVCENEQNVSYSTPNTAGNSYVWTVNGGTIASGQGSNSINVNWGGNGNGSVSIQEGAPGNCDTTVVVNVTINPRPAPAISGPAQFCENTAGAVYSTPNNAGNSYQWTISGGSITSGQNTNSISVQWGAAGAASVQVTETNGFNCSQSSNLAVTINPKPNPVITGPLNVCQNETGVYSVANVAGNNYTWTVTGGQINSGQGSNSIIVQWGNAGPGSVQLLQSTAAGCDTTVSINMTIDPKPTPGISGLVAVCAQQTGVTYSSPNVSGNSYAWTVSGGNIVSGQGTASIVVDWGASAGNFTVSLTESNGFACDSTVSLNVTVNPLPNPQINGTTALCAQSQGVQYSVVGNPGSSYNWTISGGNIISGQGSNQITVNWGAPGAGNLTLTETNSFGCVTTVSATITLFQLPNPALSGPQTLCANDPPSTYNVSGLAGSQYSWVVTGGAITSGQGSSQITVNWSGAGSGTVEVTETTINGCVATVSIPVTIHPSPAPVLQGPATACERTDNHVYTVTGSPGSSFTWSVSGGTITAGQGSGSITVSWFAAGNGVITLTETNTFGCSTTQTYSVAVLPRPTPQINGPLSWCENVPSAGYSVGNVSGASYQWTVSGGSIVSGQGSSSIQVDWGAQGTGSITLFQQNSNGCDTTVQISVNLRPVPIAVISPVDASGCVPLEVAFEASQSLFSDFYTWDFGDGAGGSGVNTNHTFYTAGNYTVSMEARNAWGCKDTATASINAFAIPVADFEMLFSGGGEGLQIPYDSLILINQSTGASGWNWDFGDGSSDTLFQPTHSYTEPGTYTIRLQVYSPEGCFDETQRTVEVSAPIKLFVPSGFTPNGDGLNDEFFVVSTNVSELDVEIYDRWGAMIFASKQLDFRWGGFYKEQPVPEGVYVYKVIGRTLDGQEVKKSGTITVLR